MVKVERSFPAPESLATEKLKSSGSYNKPDVVERLSTDFHNKCYICELNDLQDPQVEHLRPHFKSQYIDRKFDWNNLFWSCGHCNGVKNSGMRIHKSDFRFTELNKEMNKLYNTLDELSQKPNSTFAKRKLRALIRKESRFAAFKRCYIRENKPEYISYL